jgi:DNA-binding response OmpR family regulator
MRILLVEDQKHLSEAIVHMLKKQHYIVDAVYNGEDGYDYILSNIYDVVILDINLPLMDGITILKKVREQGIESNIIMLTARSELSDKLTGLNHGADDYLTKPFAMEELVARIKSLGRRISKQYIKEVSTFGDLEFDIDTQNLSTAKKSVTLTRLESELFQLLLQRKDMKTSKESIIVKLWGYDGDADDNNVEVYISFLRKKFRYLNSKVVIKTTRNVGYQLCSND